MKLKLSAIIIAVLLLPCILSAQPQPRYTTFNVDAIPTSGTFQHPAYGNTNGLLSWTNGTIHLGRMVRTNSLVPPNVITNVLGELGKYAVRVPTRSVLLIGGYAAAGGGTTNAVLYIATSADRAHWFTNYAQVLPDTNGVYAKTIIGGTNALFNWVALAAVSSTTTVTNSPITYTFLPAP